MRRPDFTRAAVATSTCVADVPENDGLASASRNARALAKRSAGSFSSAFASAAATFGGTDFRSAVTGCGVSVMIFMMICCADAPVCGGDPDSISYNTLASE